MNTCKNCGHVICYSYVTKHYECNHKVVSPYGVCDRYQPDITPAQIMRKIDASLKELEKYEDGKYELKVRPPFHQNYHLTRGSES